MCGALEEARPCRNESKRSKLSVQKQMPMHGKQTTYCVRGLVPGPKQIKNKDDDYNSSGNLRTLLYITPPSDMDERVRGK